MSYVNALRTCHSVSRRFIVQPCIVFLIAIMMASGIAIAQGPQPATSDPQLPGADALSQNAEAPSPEESSSRGHENGSALPDAPSSAREPEPAPKPAADNSSLTMRDRVRIYRQTLIRPYSIVGPAFGAGIGQAENEPPEWGQGGEGYGKRFASGIARQTISETIRFGFAAADGEDPRYHRSDDTGFWPRAQHAVVETFTSETASGRRIPAFSRFAGTYGAAFIANTWYPASRATPGYALRRGSTALASSVGFHMFQEFLPRKYFKRLGLSDATQP